MKEKDDRHLSTKAYSRANIKRGMQVSQHEMLIETYHRV
jgi:hypothetical protein